LQEKHTVSGLLSMVRCLRVLEWGCDVEREVYEVVEAV
jgi:hypothetical protein